MDVRGFVATLAGGLVGGCAGVYLGAVVGWAILDGDDLGDLGWMLVYAAAGAWTGTVAGAGLVLRLARATHARATVTWLALLAPSIMAIGIYAAVVSADSIDVASNLIPYSAFVLCVLLTAYLPRRLATRHDAPTASSRP